MAVSTTTNKVIYSAGQYNASYADQGANVCANTASGGYNL